MTQIRYVLTAAERLNFTKAAADCGVSQPALTKGIKALERELGAPVFHREGKRVLLTEFGKSMLPHLRQIEEGAEAAKVVAQNYQLLERVPIRLGVLETVGHLRLARFLSGFEAQHDGLDLSVTTGSMKMLADQLEDDEIDLAILNKTEDVAARFNTFDLYGERYVVVFPTAHRLGQLNAVSLSDLSGERYVDRLSCEMCEMVMQVCETEDVQLYARFRSEREDWVQAMVLAGLGFAFMPEYSVTLPGLIQRPLVAPEVSRGIAIATARGRRHSPGTSALMRAAKNFAWPG